MFFHLFRCLPTFPIPLIIEDTIFKMGYIITEFRSQNNNGEVSSLLHPPDTHFSSWEIIPSLNLFIATVPHITNQWLCSSHSSLYIHTVIFFFLNFFFGMGVQPVNSVLIFSGGQQRESDRRTHVSILPQTPFPSRLPHNIEQSSLCCAVGPCWLSISNIVQPKLPNYPFPPSFPWQP